VCLCVCVCVCVVCVLCVCVCVCVCIKYDYGVSDRLHTIIAGPVGPYHGELGGVTDNTSIRLFGGHLYTDSTLFEDICVCVWHSIECSRCTHPGYPKIHQNMSTVP
jgi:hypothetical protein